MPGIIYMVHFINNAGEDVYTRISSKSDAEKLVEELRGMNVPAEILVAQTRSNPIKPD